MERGEEAGGSHDRAHGSHRAADRRRGGRVDFLPGGAAVGRAPGGADRGQGGSFFEVEVGRDDARIRDAARRVLRDAVAEATEASPGVSVKAEIGEGSAGQLLLDAAL